jgi:hypothetical protein
MVVAIVAGSNLEALQTVADQAKTIYDNDFILPSAPEHPEVTVVPGDKRVYVSWEDNAEQSKDPYYVFTSDPASLLYDAKYLEQDFEGYRVWRSRTGLVGDWELLAEYDKTSSTPRSAAIARLAGEWTGTVDYDAATVEGYILAYGGTGLFSGHEYLLRVNSDNTFSISDVTLGGIDLPLASVVDHWYETEDTPPSFEVFDGDMNSMVDSTGAQYFDGCYLCFGGMVLTFTGAAPSEDVIFRIVGSVEEVEGENSGLRYAYIDSNLTNGVTYYYDVTAYDFQITSPHSLENGIEGIAVTPMSLGAGVPEAAFLEMSHIAGVSDGTVKVSVADPDKVTGHEYEVTFSNTPLDSTVAGTFFWHLKDLDTGEYVLTDQTAVGSVDDIPPVEGLSIRVSSPVWGGKMTQVAGTGEMALFFAQAYTGSPARHNNFRDYELRFVGWVAEGDSAKGIEMNGYLAACPFEAWDIGHTPDDPSDDVRLWPVWYAFYGHNGVWDPDEYIWFPDGTMEGNKYSEDWLTVAHTGADYFGYPPVPSVTRFDLDYRFAFTNATHDWQVSRWSPIHTW